MDEQKVDRLAKIIWDYHHVNHQLNKADCIIALGSHDVRVAKYAAELFLKRYSTLLVCSGGWGDWAKKHWGETEAEKFAKVAVNGGVPQKSIFVESKSTNTGENVLFSKNLLLQKGVVPRKILLVHKPYMERRTYATFKKVWPDAECIVTSPQVSYEKYTTRRIPKEDLISRMVSDFHKILIYPDLGFQIPQEVPFTVSVAYQKLVELGYPRKIREE